MWFLTNNIDSHSIGCAIYNVYKHKVLRLRSTDLEIIFKIEQNNFPKQLETQIPR